MAPYSIRSARNYHDDIFIILCYKTENQYAYWWNMKNSDKIRIWHIKSQFVKQITNILQAIIIKTETNTFRR
jgi:hypothetical protein